MKKAISLLIFLFLSIPTFNGIHIENSVFEKHVSLQNFDGRDGAHFKYYENDSHIRNWYEWWYFNVKDGNKALLLYFFTFGNLNNKISSIVGVFAAFFDGDESIESITIYPLINYSLDYEKCNVTIAGNFAREHENGYTLYYNSPNLEIHAEIHNHAMPFGGKPTMLDEWQWMAWYVAVPYGNASVEVVSRQKQCKFYGIAYHDHNWGMAKPAQLKWDWGEFYGEEYAIIYGMALGKGGIYFVNESFVKEYNISISYEKWRFINGFLKPVLIHIYSNDGKIDLYVEMKKYYVIGAKNIGKPYLLGHMHGKFYHRNITAIGFYEHHGLQFKI
ncbi:MAG: hypothetical protein J7K47_02745 [Thermoplasmata archaeon]|nr:hypothetical protein [Thermoplasmata archaeon]